MLDFFNQNFTEIFVIIFAFFAVMVMIFTKKGRLSVSLFGKEVLKILIEEGKDRQKRVNDRIKKGITPKNYKEVKDAIDQ